MDLKPSMFGTTTLGALIDALEHARTPADAAVQFDFCYLAPTQLASYRGYYEHLALGWTDKFTVWPTASALLTELKQAVGRSYEGWKGGTYTMARETPLWVANRGEAGGTGIVGIDVDIDASTVILCTAKVD